MSFHKKKYQIIEAIDRETSNDDILSVSLDESPSKKYVAHINTLITHIPVI